MLSSTSSSSASTELSSTTTTSPSSSLPPSPFTFSPPQNTTFGVNIQINGGRRPRATSEAQHYDQDQDMAFSSGTQLTTPPSSNPSPWQFQLPVIHQNLPLNIPAGGGHGHAWGLGPQLTYPSVPPPSLSSSLGSPIISRRNSVGPQQRQASPPPPPSPIAESTAGNLSSTTMAESNSQGVTRRASIERGARVAETGSLVSRNRGATAGGSTSRRGARSRHQ